MKGTRPGKLPPPSQAVEGGRTCAYPACETKLSIYNGADLCWQHTEIVFPNFRGKRLEKAKG
jgi:hypothetical protein